MNRPQKVLPMRLRLLFLILFLMAIPALAHNVFVSNKPYQGQVLATASDIRFVLSELAEALNLEVEESEEGWILGGFPVSTLQERNKVWVQLKALPEELVRVVRNPELNTVDLFVQQSVEGEGSEEPWGMGGTLVFFYADWSEACRAMEQTMAHVALSRTLKCEFLNIDYPKTPVYKKYAHRFEGDRIPFYLILDTRGRKIDSFSGFLTYTELLDKLRESFSKVKD